MIGCLRGKLGAAVTTRDVTEGQLPDLAVRIHGHLRLLFRVCGLLLASGFDSGGVVGSQDFCPAQIFVGINVFRFLRLFARSFLAGGFGYILRSPGAALRGAGK